MHTHLYVCIHTQCITHTHTHTPHTGQGTRHKAKKKGNLPDSLAESLRESSLETLLQTSLYVDIDNVHTVIMIRYIQYEELTQHVIIWLMCINYRLLNRRCTRNTRVAQLSLVESI